MPSILGANTLSGGFNVANSCRFDEGSSDNLSANSFGTPTSDKIYTLSWWFKRTKFGEAVYQFGWYDGSRTNSGDIVFDAGDTLSFYHGSDDGNGKLLMPNRLFRDPSAWTHVVWAVDTTQGTASNRIKIYFNGVQETSFSTEVYPDQNAVSKIFHDSNNRIAAQWNAAGTTFYNGYMAEIVFIDGQQLTPTSFGEFDEDSEIWKPIDVSDLTFGNNGFYLDFEDSSALGDDVSGNNNDFTVNNLTAVDQSTDTCTNNHATLNNLFPEANIAYSEGNLKVTADGSANWSSAIGNIGLTSGKWYWEWTATSSSNAFAGIASEALVNSTLISDATPYDQNGLILYFTDGRKTVDGTSTESHFTAWSSGTMSCALDLDSGTRTIKMYHNGSQTGDTINLTANFASGAPVFPVFMVNAGSNPSLINVNFGSPFYANSSDAADGNGYGAFEYAPPSGYYTINTKNLAEHG